MQLFSSIRKDKIKYEALDLVYTPVKKSHVSGEQEPVVRKRKIHVSGGRATRDKEKLRKNYMTAFRFRIDSSPLINTL